MARLAAPLSVLGESTVVPEFDSSPDAEAKIVQFVTKLAK
jgi:hypothetical protein